VGRSKRNIEGMERGRLMKLLDAIQTKGELKHGGRVQIPDCSRSDLPQFFVDMGYKVGVEIGVENGFFSEELLRVGLKLYSIDPWIHYPSWNYQKSEDRMERVYNRAIERLGKYENSIVIRKTSMDAIEDFADESLDFVYIDGNHEFRYVAEDISEWEKKVRKGGIISGHDYFTPRRKSICTVAPILHAYTDWFNIKTWYVLGSKKGRLNETRDRTRSWFWIKE
jgi:hypothetical protein